VLVIVAVADVEVDDETKDVFEEVEFVPDEVVMDKKVVLVEY
jgi:hypothetical protein